MKTKVVVCLLALFSLGGLSVRAQESQRINVFLGYSYLQANPTTTGLDSFHLNGGSASTDYNFTPWLAGVADFGGYTNGDIGRGGAGGTLSTYLFGPRATYRHFGRITPFGQVLFGVARTNASAFETAHAQNAFAMTVGGGVDYKVAQHFSLRPMQVEYLLSRFSETTSGNQTQNNLRVSTGVMLRF